MKIIAKTNPLEELGTAIGVGLLAGLAGTAAITISQMIEMKLTKRPPSNVPAEAVSKVLDVKSTDDSKKEKVSQEVHWVYGTSWGIVRGLISLSGLKGIPATLIHLAAIWGTAQVMLPSLKLSPPVTKEAPETIGIDVLHHTVYAVTAGLVYDAVRE
jgi:hypothetical protein